MNTPAVLVLEDGSTFHGTAIGVTGSSVGEVVFNTSMTGYQEILSDPSYAKQMITFTSPHIGNVGWNAEDDESSAVFATGMIIKDYPITSSSWRQEGTLKDYLQAHNIVAIADIDTRRLTRILRDKGSMNGCIQAGDVNVDDALTAAKQFAGLKGMDLAKEVTVSESYNWTEATWHTKAPSSFPYHVVVYDFGVKRNILRMLLDRGCKLTVVPAQTSASDVLAMNPDGVLLSNGPGDPDPCQYAIAAIQEIVKKKVPVFGICLGFQLLALASGAKTLKMKFGHHGANHPVQDLKTKRVFITSQNHGFAVDEESLPETAIATHRSLFDSSLQGFERSDAPAFGFQGHPEASPGPQDIAPLFDQFIDLIKTAKK